ncbi:MAG: S8 family serine peptidase [Acidimicrobiia bacterium]
MRRSLVALVGVAVAAGGVLAAVPKAFGDPARSPYIVTLRVAASAPGAAAAESGRGARVTHVYSHAYHGYAAELTEAEHSRLASDPEVAAITPDYTYSAVATTYPDPRSWGLDRVDQRVLPLDRSYTAPDGGASATAYVIDTGVLYTHPDFGGRAAFGIDTVSSQPNNGVDLNGHGTHVAGTIGGSTYGVAKGIHLVGVRVLDSAGYGTTSDIVAGIDWVTRHHAANAVANMSLGCWCNDPVMNAAVSNSIASGVFYSLAAGNNAGDACSFSPAMVRAAFTVGATDTNDSQAFFSDYGPCLDAYAPGVEITSDWLGNGTNTISGTSMAAPHVAGTAAMYLDAHPGTTPAATTAELVSLATSGVVTGTGPGSPNLLLYSQVPVPTVPAAPAKVTAVAGVNSATVRWTLPAGPITSVTVTAHPFETRVSRPGTATETTITGLAASPVTFTLHATNSVGDGPESPPSNQVIPTNPTPALVIGTSSLPSGRVGVPYPRTTLVASGGRPPIHWSQTGLPAGLSLDTTTGVITGTPTGLSGQYSVAIGASDSGTPVQSALVYLSLAVDTTPVVERPVRVEPPAAVQPVTPTPGRSGYWMLDGAGNVYSFGDAGYSGGVANTMGPPIFGLAAVHIEPTPSGHGYWILDSLGRVYAFGDARWAGNADALRFAAYELASSLSATPSGNGYWIFTSRGRVLAFGDAQPYGDVAAMQLNGPVLGSIATPSGHGYYMVASDGGIFAFGDAVFRGSMGGVPLNAPVRSLVPTAGGNGYWLVASDGGIFAFGDAVFRGSMGSTHLNAAVVGMVRYGDGYLMVGADGGIFDFSDRPYQGSLGDHPPASHVTSVAALTG